jgi:anti-sigma B factor antagonist
VSDAITTEISSYRAGSTIAVIEAPASFDIYNVSAVRELAIALKADGVTGIVFDLGATTFLDNTALGVIAGTSARLRPADGRIAVAAAAEPAARLFRVTGLTKIVPMFGTCKEAVSFLQLRAGEK